MEVKTNKEYKMAYKTIPCPVCQGQDLVDRLKCFACKGDGLSVPMKSQHEIAMDNLADDIVNGIKQQRQIEPVAVTHSWRM